MNLTLKELLMLQSWHSTYENEGFSDEEDETLSKKIDEEIMVRGRSNMLQVTNDKGITFNVRLVREGDGFGVNYAVIHNSNEPMVEFYDSRFTQGFGERGQFVTRYNVSTIKKHSGRLSLDMGVSAWAISAVNVEQVKEWFEVELE